MGSLASFIMITLDGFYEGPNQEFDFWQAFDSVFDEFSTQQLADADALVFGRKTYDGMSQYWPTDDAIRANPMVAELMNSKPKLMVSSSGATADWNQSTIVRTLAELSDAKSQVERLLILGSPCLTANAAQAGLLDELRIMINPIAIGSGKSLFNKMLERLPLNLAQTRAFASGNVLLIYHLKT